MCIHINDSIRIRLTDVGRGILREKYSRSRVSPPREIDGWVTMQLWDFVAVMGPHTSLVLDPPFLEIEKKD